MNQQEIAALAQRQRDYFSTGITQDVNFRLEQLQKLRDAVQASPLSSQKFIEKSSGESPDQNDGESAAQRIKDS